MGSICALCVLGASSSSFFFFFFLSLSLSFFLFCSCTTLFLSLSLASPCRSTCVRALRLRPGTELARVIKLFPSSFLLRLHSLALPLLPTWQHNLQQQRHPSLPSLPPCSFCPQWFARSRSARARASSHSAPGAPMLITQMITLISCSTRR